MVAIEIGQSWVSQADGSVMVVQGKSDLLVNWWKVRSAATGWSWSIDEATLRTMYRVEPDDAASSLAAAVAPD